MSSDATTQFISPIEDEIHMPPSHGSIPGDDNTDESSIGYFQETYVWINASGSKIEEDSFSSPEWSGVQPIPLADADECAENSWCIHVDSTGWFQLESNDEADKFMYCSPSDVLEFVDELLTKKETTTFYLINTKYRLWFDKSNVFEALCRSGAYRHRTVSEDSRDNLLE